MVHKLLKIFSITFFVIAVIFAIILGFLIKKSDESYWESQGESWKLDCEFLGVDEFKPKKYLTENQNLKNSSIKLLNAEIQGVPYTEYENEIIISEEYYKNLNPNHALVDPLDNCTGVNAFLVIQKDNKAIITFHYSLKAIDLEKAEKTCLESYKTYPYDKIYLELVDDKWTVVDIFRSA